MAAKKKPTVRKKAARSTPAWKSKASTIEGFLEGLTPEKREAIVAARKLVQANIPKGYAEYMDWGCINWGIPLSEFPETYNGHPITYIALGANKNKNTLHLMACYVGGKETAFLRDEFKKAGKKFDMGKSCLHFNTLDDLELKSVAKVIGSVSKERYLEMYKKFKGIK